MQKKGKEKWPKIIRELIVLIVLIAVFTGANIALLWMLKFGIRLRIAIMLSNEMTLIALLSGFLFLGLLPAAFKMACKLVGINMQKFCLEAEKIGLAAVSAVAIAACASVLTLWIRWRTGIALDPNEAMTVILLEFICVCLFFVASKIARTVCRSPKRRLEMIDG